MYRSSRGCTHRRRSPIGDKRRDLLQNIATTCFLAALFLSIGCGDPTAPPSQLATIVESQDRIVSENGELQLTRGTLAIRSISLIASDGNVPLLNSVTLDLAVHEQNLPLSAAIPMGEYTGLRIELAPGSGGPRPWTWTCKCRRLGNRFASPVGSP